jgi:hypothetical protein
MADHTQLAQGARPLPQLARFDQYVAPQPELLAS